MVKKLIFFMVWTLSLLTLSGCGAGDEAFVQAFDAYQALLKSGAYADMYAMTESHVSEETFISRHENIYSGIGATNIAYAIKGVEKIDGGRRIAYRQSMETSAGKIEFDNSMDIVQGTDGKYLVSWSADVIHPELSSDRPVRVVITDAKRGNVYDKNGTLLAGDGIVKSVVIVPGKLGEDRDGALLKIAEVLNMDAEILTERLAAKWVNDSTAVPVAELSAEDVTTKERLLEIPGIRIDDKAGRIYPHGKEIAGEDALRPVLFGQEGRRIEITTADGQIVKVLAEIQVIDGQDVRLNVEVSD